MNKEKTKLIVKNMELLLQLLKLEIGEETNVVKLEDLLLTTADKDYYEPDYFEEE